MTSYTLLTEYKLEMEFISFLLNSKCSIKLKKELHIRNRTEYTIVPQSCKKIKAHGWHQLTVLNIFFKCVHK